MIYALDTYRDVVQFDAHEGVPHNRCAFSEGCAHMSVDGRRVLFSSPAVWCFCVASQ